MGRATGAPAAVRALGGGARASQARFAGHPRLFLPVGADGAAFRAQGFATVAALAPDDTPQRLRCTHELRDGAPVPVVTKD